MNESGTGAAGSNRRELATVLAVGCAFAAGILVHADFLSGPWYWKWPWRNLSVLHAFTLLAIPLIPIAAAIRALERDDPGRDARLPLALLMIANLLLQILGLLCHPGGFTHLKAIVTSPVVTSYFTDAQKIVDFIPWMENFHTANLELHSSTHPPGPILFYYVWLKILGPAAGAVAGGLAVGLLATLGIPALYSFAGLWTEERRPRLWACALYALLPALIVFFPEFDQIYPIFSMLMMTAWVKALRGSRRHALILAGTVFGATFFAYNLLATGAFLLYFGLYFLSRERWAPSTWKTVGRTAAVALGGAAALYALLWAATGYNPVLSFIHALRVQGDLASRVDRPWFPCAVFDLYDFFLGSGMVAAPLLLLFFQRSFEEFEWGRADLVLSLIGLASLLTVDLSGLLRAETARVWMFLQPLVLVPAARELLRFDARGRAAVFGVQWLIGVALKCSLSFNDP
jgi:hypothetical protein